jgi:hypothetical protein
MAAAIGGPSHPLHVSVMTLLEKAGEPLSNDRPDRGRRGYAGDVESRRAGFGQDELFETFAHDQFIAKRANDNDASPPQPAPKSAKLPADA